MRWPCRIGANRQIRVRVKNKKRRVVLLSQRAIKALVQAKADAEHPAMREMQHAHAPYISPPGQENQFVHGTSLLHTPVKQAFIALSLRDRPQYNRRLTYATLCLMTGIILLSSQINLGIACKCCCPPMPDGSVLLQTGMKFPSSECRKWVLNRYWRTSRNSVTPAG